jgi:hypothetical protein
VRTIRPGAAPGSVEEHHCRLVLLLIVQTMRATGRRAGRSHRVSERKRRPVSRLGIDLRGQARGDGNAIEWLRSSKVNSSTEEREGIWWRR